MTPAQIRERMEEDLFITRQALEILLPPLIAEIASKVWGIDTSQALHAWERELVKAVLEPAGATTKYSQRILCPLCNASSSHTYAVGFTYPLGLERHLLGKGANRCPIINALFRWGVDMMHFSQARKT